MRFTKGHGTGNDFVLLPDPDGQLGLTSSIVAALCDRRRGIGADGVLRVVRAAKHPDAVGYAGAAEWFMDYWNADGTLAEMCGNGVRVFARYLISSGLAEPVDGLLPIATRAGVVRAEVGGEKISVDLGRPRIIGSALATLGGLTLAGTAVDCGNPHLVCVLPESVDLAGLDLTRSPGFDPAAFPTGVNVEFVAAGDDLADRVGGDWTRHSSATSWHSPHGAPPVGGADRHVRMRVYERGSAETLSCGSGACAVAAVALRDAGRTGGVVAVDVPGGRLTVTLEDGSCWLAGPAVLVAQGEIDLATLGA
ncbi:diaminopimelate epimerase [Plantactinospora sp. WMMC1484]|uniref:diaminopimelate epimerase n=1 Tax=Plantactinospora sp. WMMC1484 TaxID=3404122 RepID=UPI003BF4D781